MATIKHIVRDMTEVLTTLDNTLIMLKYNSLADTAVYSSVEKHRDSITEAIKLMESTTK